MKKFIGLALVVMIALVAFTGCPQDVNPLEPIVGTWQIGPDGASTVLLLKSNHDMVETGTLGIFGSSVEGTWTSNSDTVTFNYAGGTDKTWNYELMSKNEELKLSSGINSKTYTRQ